MIIRAVDVEIFHCKSQKFALLESTNGVDVQSVQLGPEVFVCLFCFCARVVIISRQIKKINSLELNLCDELIRSSSLECK